MEALIEASLRLAIPLLLAALGELIVEKAGLINIGTEGMMLFGAFTGFAVAATLGNPAAGALAAMLAGAGAATVFGYFSVVRRADQIVVGTAINLLGLGATGLAARALYSGSVPTITPARGIAVPFLSDLPVIGPLLFEQSGFAYAAIAVVFALSFFLRRTRAGLRLRAVGESARSADAEGISVVRVRMLSVISAGMLAGLAGAALSLSQSNTFAEGMTAGRGFIALTIVIFGRWRPSGVALAAVFFGAAIAVQHRLQARGTALPYQIPLMLPYLLTLGVLFFASGRSRAPSDLGQVYDRSAH